jgi:hypothetical protein
VISPVDSLFGGRSRPASILAYVMGKDAIDAVPRSLCLPD